MDILAVREILMYMKTLFWDSFSLAKKKSQCLIGSKKISPYKQNVPNEGIPVVNFETK